MLGTLVTSEMRVAKGKSARSKLITATAMLEGGELLAINGRIKTKTILVEQRWDRGLLVKHPCGTRETYRKYKGPVESRYPL